MTTAPQDMPFISVIIPHLNQPEFLARCLESLSEQTYSSDRFEVIVIDNGSDQSPLSLVEKYGFTRFETESEKGAGPARNRGMAIALGDCFAFIDADCTADPNWLAAGCQKLNRCDLAGGRIIVTAANADSATPAECFELLFAFQQERYIKKERFAVTANLFARRDVYRMIGGFRNGISEDKDWCQRAVGQGSVIHYVKDAVVRHPARRTFDELSKKWRRLVLEDYNLRRNNLNFIIIWPLRISLVLLSILPHSFNIVVSQRKITLHQKFYTILILARLRIFRANLMISLLIKQIAS